TTCSTRSRTATRVTRIAWICEESTELDSAAGAGFWPHECRASESTATPAIAVIGGRLRLTIMLCPCASGEEVAAPVFLRFSVFQVEPAKSARASSDLPSEGRTDHAIRYAGRPNFFRFDPPPQHVCAFRAG